MNAIFITDIHGRFGALLKLPPAELLLVGGDITNFGTPEDLHEFAETATSRFPRVLAVAGNCDPAAAPDVLAVCGIGLPLEGRAEGGVRFFGISGAPFNHGSTPFEWPDGAAHAWMPRPSADGLPSVLLSHAPPRRVLTGRLLNGFDAGSRTVEAAVCRLRPVLVLSGHIHEARGTDALAYPGTQAVNPGPLRAGFYAALSFRPGLPPGVSLCTL